MGSEYLFFNYLRDFNLVYIGFMFKEAILFLSMYDLYIYFINKCLNCRWNIILHLYVYDTKSCALLCHIEAKNENNVNKVEIADALVILSEAVSTSHCAVLILVTGMCI